MAARAVGGGPWRAELAATQEGEYRVQVLAPFTGEVLGERALELHDRPAVEGVSADLEDGLFKVSVSVRDLSGISRVLVELSSRNYTTSSLRVDERGNEVYQASIPLKDFDLEDLCQLRPTLSTELLPFQLATTPLGLRCPSSVFSQKIFQSSSKLLVHLLLLSDH